MGIEKSQGEIVIKHLRRKSMTAIEAFTMYRITRLAARIFELRKQGYLINTKIEKNNNAHYARYSLIEKH